MVQLPKEDRELVDDLVAFENEKPASTHRRRPAIAASDYAAAHVPITTK
jgi:hypothetical protein